jgi:UDP-N-acetylglucosamine 1-carboxyvinyltransferase
MGFSVTVGDNWAMIDKPSEFSNTVIRTLPFPGFPTDLQAPMMTLATTIPGINVIIETIFENRFTHAPELRRMGADITIEGNVAIVRGVPKLSGAPVMMSDLRAGAALIIAALSAEGTTEIRRIYHSDRGYENMESKFNKIGANIERLSGGIA